MWNPEVMSYLVFQLEQCPDTGNVHWQGYCEFKKQLSLSTVQQELYGGDKFHVEARRGTASEARDYCMKDDTSLGFTFEMGVLSKQGERVDLIEMKDSIVEGTRVEEIMLARPMAYHQYGRTMNAIEDLVLRNKKRTWMTQGIWYWGETGAGKSHRAFTEHGDDYYVKMWGKDTDWWDAYRGQSVVIFNEFRGQIDYAQLLQLLDKWPHWVSRRGREPMPFLAKTIVFTCTVLPAGVFKRQAEKADSLDQLMRRLSCVEVSKEGREVINLEEDWELL